MSSWKATSRVTSNIAFIKYWGNRDEALRLPQNSSLSMNLAGLSTTTTVEWDETLPKDVLVLNGQETEGGALKRVEHHLDIMRQRLGFRMHASVTSENNFPTGVGIASSASSFAALTVAAAAAAKAEISERELTTLARMGSGSASRSIPTGFVEWYAADKHEDSYAESIAAPDHWNLIDVIVIVSSSHKEVGSTEGHQSAKTSDLQPARVAGADERLQTCKAALLERDFTAFAEVVERDSNLMHSVMMTSRPPLFYWMPQSLMIMNLVRRWRTEGLNVCYTLDAGPNVHCLCLSEHADEVRNRLQNLSDIVDIRTASPGGPAIILNS